MHILVVGLNYKTAPVEIREKLSFLESQIGEGMVALKSKKSILENVIISTCNRTEIYAVVDQLHTGKYYIKEYLSEWFSINRDEFESSLFFYENDEAIRHLYKVTCGLDSMVLGETQILGQVRTSFLLAQEKATVGTVFNRLFKQAITLAKRVHTETEIGANAVSVSYAAVELGKKIFGSLDGKRVLIIGAGKMSELAIQNLQGSGASEINVVNRTFETGKKLAEKYGGTAYEFSDLPTGLAGADIVISSTGASHYVLTKAMMEHVKNARKGNPMFLVDIAVPRDIDPEIGELESVFLYDIDDLEGIVEANLQEREHIAQTILQMIEEDLEEFQQWLNTLGVVPLIASLREKALSIQAETMKSIQRKIPDLTEREQKVISKHTKSIINQMLKDPIIQIKELAGGPNGEEALRLFQQIFQLDNPIPAEATDNQEISDPNYITKTSSLVRA
ncbi:glutamyl-tRNA reductase [Caldibacillus lycopersici]|uniref:Glutamyl-tRNA reductase n=1 Tax=Perspicuibacillus lycopersici TaxID=1325689 RepID=A0AAE3IW97_9BACI|nr:glutamyl-tRNA reductase [Perspicuibacillus lycopersici]MCU9614039.1 glutamyl-tRNA reductase [Perspicuibacillus lycopersici]